MEPLATRDAVAEAWRPLTGTEPERADYLLGFASRRIRRRWRDVDARLAAGVLTPEDVADVVVGLVLQALPLAPVPGARSWQVTSGAESRTVTLGSAHGDPNRMTFEDWMVEILDGTAPGGALPVFSAPPAQGFPDPALRPRFWPDGLL